MNDPLDDHRPTGTPRGLDIAALTRAEVEVNGYGIVTLRTFGLRDIDVLGRLLETTENSREFTVQVLHHQVEAPLIELGAIRSWTDEEIARILHTFTAKQPAYRRLEAKPGDSVFEIFREDAQKEYSRWMERSKQLRHSLGLENEMRKLAELTRGLVPLHSFYPPSLQDAVRMAGLQSQQLSDQLSGITKYTQRMADATALSRNIFGGTAANFGMLDAATAAKALAGSVSSLPELTEQARRQFEWITQSANKVSEQLLGSFRALEQLTAKIDTQALYRSIPDLNSFIPQWRTFQGTLLLADELGWGFAYDIIPQSLLESVKATDPRVRAAVITNRLAAETRAGEFETSLREMMQSSLLLQKRWRIVELVLRCHRRREYEISIPPMLAQVEGVFTDLMVLKGEARRRGGDLIAWVRGSGPKLGRTQKHIKLTGLGPKIQQSDFREHPETQEIVAFLLDSITGPRNGILHGRDVRYGKAKLSVQLLLVFALLSQVIEAVEANRLSL